MKKYLILIVLSITSMICYAQNSRSSVKYKKKSNSTIKPLTENDRKNYVLGIDQNKLSKIKYTSLSDYSNYKGAILFIPVVLTNYSNDTLKYLSMTCSWEEFYVTD